MSIADYERLVVPLYEGDINEHLELEPGFLPRDREPRLEAHDYIFDYDLHYDTLIISFGGSGIGEDGEACYAFGKFLKGHPVSHLQLRDQFGCWYFNGIRGLSTDIGTTVMMLRWFIDQSCAERIVCVGTSAGGFAAILFGVLLEVDEVVAINPQTLLQRNVECFAHGNLYRLKWTNPDEIVYRDLLHLPPSETRVHVAYGTDDPVDCFHSGRMRIRPDVLLHPHSGTHRTTPLLLRDENKLAALLKIDDLPTMGEA